MNGQEYLVNERRLTESEGLSHNQVQAMWQDADGFMWIGTKYGLNRYDGHTFRWFTKEQDGLSSNNIREMLEDEAGWLWLIQWEERFGEYTFYSIDLFDPVTYEIKSWQDAVEEAPPFLLSEVEKLISTPGGQVVFQLEGGRFYVFSYAEGFTSLPFDRGLELYGGAVGDQFWGRIDNQLVCIDRKGNVLDSFSLRELEGVTRMLQDGAGNIWFLLGQFRTEKRFRTQGTGRVLLRKANGEKKVNDLWNDWGLMEVFLLDNRNAETIFIVTSLKVFELDTAFQYSEVPILLEEYPVKYTHCFWVDHNGVIWYGHRDGVNLWELKRSKFRNYLQLGGIDGAARGVVATPDRIYANVQGGGGSLDRETGRFKLYYGDYTNFKTYRCFPMIQTPSGEVWTANDRLYRLDSLGEIDRIIRFSEEERGPRIWSFLQTTDGEWWVSKGIGEINFFHEKKHDQPQLFTRYNGFDQLRNTLTWQFLEEDEGLWLATDQGLFLLDRQKGVVARYAPDAPKPYQIPAQHIYFIHRSPGRGLFLATRDAGLVQLLPSFLQGGDSTGIRQLTRLDGLPSNELYAIHEDTHGHLWISTRKGLVQFSLDDSTIKTYFEEQGITHNEFNRLSSFQASTGELFFGGMDGITSFHPDDFYPKPEYNPPLRFASVEVLSEGEEAFEDISAKIRAENQLVFRPNDKVIRLAVSLQDYFFAGRTRYQYQIEGWSEDWTETPTNTIQLSGLSYGDYTLRVRGVGPGRQLGGEVLSLGISVLRPFYLRWWFILLWVVTIGISIWQYYYWRLQSYRNRQLLLEQMVSERTQKIRADKEVIEAQAEQLRELDAVKSRFFTNISHELRTPLTLILGPLDSVLKNNKLDNRDYTLLRLMQQNGKQLLRRINELLDLSSLDAGKMDVERDSILLYPFLQRVLAAFEGTAKLKEIRLALDYQLTPELQVLLDTDKVDKVLSNYLSNALKFTPREGAVTLRVSREGNELILQVEDTGIGLRPEDREQVFERFFQSERNEQVGGSGIGLSLCRELAHLMEGKVWVESELDAGSRFFLQLPLLETFGQVESGSTTAGVSEAERVEETPAEASRDPFQATILVVEDNASLQQYIRVLLAEYHVISAANGKIALQQLAAATERGERIRLIISDIMMPVMDGMELLERLKEEDAYRSIPVVMLTARQDADQKIQALRVGVDDYLTKPFQGEELIARVSNLVERSDQRGAAGRASAKKVKAANRKIITMADQKWLEEVETLIFANLGTSDFGISEIADQLAMSTRRFQQRIKELTGLTPKAYQREIQLEQARRLLESGEVRSVSEVSYQIGFKDQHYFSQLYKKRFGKMPSEYL